MPLPLIAEATQALSALSASFPPAAARMEPALATALVEDSSKRMLNATPSGTADASASSSNSNGSSSTDSSASDFAAIASIATLLAETGYKPRAEWQTQFEGSMAAAMATTSGGVGATEVARALAALSAWGYRLSGGLTPNALLEVSLGLLPTAPAAALGPLLLGLVGVGAKPSAAWVNEWAAVTRQALETSAAAASSGESGSSSSSGSASSAAAVALTGGDVASMAAAAARSGRGAMDEVWLSLCASAARPLLPLMSDGDLMNLGSGLHAMKFRPAAEWVAAVNEDVERRRAGGAGSADLEAASAFFAALRVL